MNSEMDMPDMVVLCGGRGTRLGNLTDAMPKPLLPIGGAPFLLRLLSQWRREGVGRFILAVHYLAEQFQDFVRQHAGRIGPVEVCVEPQPLGTGGALRFAAQRVETPCFLAANGDSYVSQPLGPVYEAHRRHGNPFTLVAVRPEAVAGGAKQKGRLLTDSIGDLREFSTEPDVQDGWVNAGVYVMAREAPQSWADGKFDLESRILPDAARQRVRVFKSDGNLVDIGLPECYATFDRRLGPLERLFEGLNR
ncbi:MAG: sugar phosphate nucleotidyltransferase [Verrucomicrobiae bacterium]|nr:sugar phosphate nucleotidyltransferase [Verrucomicrobiae bacterium]